MNFGLCFVAGWWAWTLASSSWAQSSGAATPPPIGAPPQPASSRDIVVLPPPVPDPLEPMNRVFWGFNRGLMKVVIKPTGKVYRFIVRKPLRTGIANFGKNLNYPVRLINNLLEGKWTGARNETYRFLCNTAFGIGGFLDVATERKIPSSDADFGLTFGKWGWKPKCYLMLPLFGPSNERDALGLASDTAANPLNYVTPYPFRLQDPTTYFSPYTYYSAAVMYNNLTESVDDYVRFSDAEKDAYSEIQYAWTFARENRVADFHVKGEPDEASLETLQSVFFTFKEHDFPARGTTRSVLIPATGKNLKFTFWLQRTNAPVVYIVPGLGSHRLAETELALAELVYHNGFSAVCVSNPYNHEFMEEASSVGLPAYAPVDSHDLHVALSRIDDRMRAMYPGRMTSRALMGYSMGAFESLLIAGEQSTNQESLLNFDRYVAINTPVRLSYGIAKLDEFYNAPLAWPAGERVTNIDNTFLKIAAVTKNSFTPQASLPFDATESKFLIGLVFRFILRDVIFTSQQHHDQGILQNPVKGLRRAPVYNEILQYSFADYINKFVIPYYQSRGLDLASGDALEKSGDLRSYAATLRTIDKIRFIVNRNDFLLPNEDLDWLQSTFGADRVKVFEQGGHLGNLSNPNVQAAILEALGAAQININPTSVGNEQPVKPIRQRVP